MHEGMSLVAAPLAAMFALLTGSTLAFPESPKGLMVRIAGIQRCGGADRHQVVVEIGVRGTLRINSETVNREHSGRRLEEIFRTRALRYIFVVGEPDLEFREVAEVIDAASSRSTMLPSSPRWSWSKYARCGRLVSVSTPTFRPASIPIHHNSHDMAPARLRV